MKSRILPVLLSQFSAAFSFCRFVQPDIVYYSKKQDKTHFQNNQIDVLTAKEQLGHSDVSTTLNIYTHLDSEYKARNMDKLNSYLGDNKKNVVHS